MGRLRYMSGVWASLPLRPNSSLSAWRCNLCSLSLVMCIRPSAGRCMHSSIPRCPLFWNESIASLPGEAAQAADSYGSLKPNLT